MPRALLERLIRREDLEEREAAELLVALARERVSAPVAASLLATLRAKGETAEEIRGFAGAMRRLALRPEIPVDVAAVDVVGTGGDGSGSLNLSTGSALLAAAAGCPVIKHGNRAVSSRSGSADALEALGYVLPAGAGDAVESFGRLGFTFLFAPHFHPAMKALAQVRRALGVRTVFNLLGPLTNPAEPPYAVIGAYSADVAETLAHALSGLGIRRAFVVHGDNGWDEATPAAPYLLFDVRPGRVEPSRRDPTACGLPRCSESRLSGGDAEENAGRIAEVLHGRHGPHRDALLLGAGLALEVSGRVGSVEQGIDLAAAAIDEGRAASFLKRLAGGFEQRAAAGAGR